MGTVLNCGSHRRFGDALTRAIIDAARASQLRPHSAIMIPRSYRSQVTQFTTVPILLALAVTPARADVETQAAMREYFAGEQRGGLVLVGMGAVGLAAGGGALAEGSPRAEGAGYVLLGMGTVHVAAGAFVYFASRARARKFESWIERDRAGFVVTESKRMRGVSRQFLALKITEVVLIAGGVAMIAIGASDDRPRVEGAGYALAAEMLATLAFDIVAARRAGRYRGRLAANAQITEQGFTLGVVGRF